MSNADIYKKAVKELRAAGWPVEYMSGWESRKNTGVVRVPQGIMYHHTGGKATSTSYMMNPKDRPQLKVLCNVHVTHDHKIKIVAAGPTSHAGYGYKPNYDKAIAGTASQTADMKPGADGTFSANTYMIGVEVDGAGGPKEWDQWTIDALVAFGVAIHKAMGWTKPRVMAHKEFSRRKPGDPYMNMGTMRSLIAAGLKNGIPKPGDTVVVKPSLGSRFLSKDGNDNGSDVAELAALLKQKGYDTGLPADVFGPKMDAAVRDFQAQNGLTVDGIVGPATISKLKAETTPADPGNEEKPVTEPPIVEPAPQPQPEVPKRYFRLLQINVQAERWGGLNDSSSAPGKWIKGQSASIILTSETNEESRNAIRKALGASKYLTYLVGYVSVMWSNSWKHLDKKSYELDTPYHGAIRATLQDPKTNLTMDVISLHLKPSASYPGKSESAIQNAKLDDLRKIMSSLYRKGTPTIVGGDFNTSKSADVMVTEFKFNRGTPNIATTDSGKFLDAVYVAGIEVRKSTLVNPGAVSDHKGWLVQGTLAQSTL